MENSERVSHSEPPAASVAVLTALCTLILAVTLKNAIWGGAGVPCLVRMVTGMPCPSCGLTRSIAAVWRGDLAGSWSLHPLGVPSAALLSIYALLSVGSCFGTTWRARRAAVVKVLLRWQTGVGLVVLTGLVWALRIAGIVPADI